MKPSVKRISARPGEAPPPEVVAAFNAGSVRMIRRAAVYESDGETLWNPDTENDPDFKRLVDGNVNVDYSSPERRKLDITLNNKDKKLRQDPNGGFWYDKIIKVYRGVTFQGSAVTPPAALIQVEAPTDLPRISRFLMSIGLKDLDYLPTVTSPDQLKNYSVIVAHSGQGKVTQPALLAELWRSGKHVITLGTGNGVAEIPHVSATVASPDWGISPVLNDTPTSGSFTTEVAMSGVKGENLLPPRVGEFGGSRYVGVTTYPYLFGYEGQTITISFDIRSSVANTTVTVYPYQNNGISIENSSAFPGIGTDYVHRSYTTKVKNFGSVNPAYHKGQIGFYVYSDAVPVIYLKNVKIELGPVETAPNDRPVASGTAPTGLTLGGTTLASWAPGSTPQLSTASFATSPFGGHWYDLHLPQYAGPQAHNLSKAMVDYMRGYYSRIEWETQVGEFMIDNLNEDQFPDLMKVTGRDYAKKLLLSKITQTSTFEKGTKLREFVKAIAINGGIDPLKMRIGIGNEVLSSDMSYERGTDRWTILQEACESFEYEIFFDAFGWLVVRPMIDPTTDPISWTFNTGKKGNLVGATKSLSDSRIYNHICVYGDPADGEERLPYFAEVRNENPESPTNIKRLGDRLYTYASTFFTSDKQCLEYAKTKMKVLALEQYDISWSSLFYPWLEVGEVNEIFLPDRLPHEPTRYFIDTLDIPLNLGPMGGTGKRVTFVGSAGAPDEELEESE